MLLVGVAAVAFVSASTGSYNPTPNRLPPKPPRFSWGTVPLHMHSGNGSGPLSNDAAKFMARFPLVTMAGFQGNHNLLPNGTTIGCCNEDTITPFATKVKANDNTTRVLFYQNSLINFPEANLSHRTPESYLLHDRRGRLVYLGGCGATHAAPNHTIYDHANPEMRKLWVDNVVKVVTDNKGLVDGVFCDRAGGIGSVSSKDLGCYDFAKGQLHEWDAGHWQTIANMQAALNPIIETAIVIGNHAQPTMDMHLAPNASYWNGKMFEHFVPTRPYVPPGDQLAALEEAGDHGLLSEVHVDDCVAGVNAMFKRSLAAFLIRATEYDYYACTSGWGFKDGWERWPVEYDRPLGAPTGPAIRAAKDILKRSFASGTTVLLKTSDATDSTWGSSCIRWGDGNVTKSGTLCTAADAFGAVYD